jgi:hypothetical protein
VPLRPDLFHAAPSHPVDQWSQIRQRGLSWPLSDPPLR